MKMAEKRRARRVSGNTAGSPAWMVTYSDMVTLLLTFFVLMLSMADINKIKFSMVVGSLRGALGVGALKGKEYKDILPLELLKQETLIDEKVQRVYRVVRSRLDKLQLSEDIQVVKDRGAVVLRLNTAVLFAPGRTEIIEKAYPVLRQVADLVRPLNLDLRIEGHTDNMPINKKDYSNWNLSVDRAVSVLEFLVQQDLLQSDRLSAAGYGGQRPVVPNDSPRHRAMNRRVDFYLEQGAYYREQLPYLIDAQSQYPF